MNDKGFTKSNGVMFATIFAIIFVSMIALGVINPTIISGSIMTGSILNASFVSGAVTGTTNFVGGFTPLSISQIDFFNTDSTLQAKTLALTFRTGGLGGYTQGTFSKDAINSSLSDSTGDVSKGFTFKAGLTNEQCTYPFKKDPTLTFSGTLRKYEYKEFSCNVLFDSPNGVWCNDSSNMTQKCSDYAKSKGGTYLLWSHAPLENMICVYGVQDGGSLARIYTPSYTFNLHSEITIDGYTSTDDDTLSGTIGTNATDSAQPFYVSGTQIGYLLWNGNLGTGNTCATVDTARKYLLNTQVSDSQYSWKVVDSTVVNDYYSKERTLYNKGNQAQAGALPKQQIIDAVVQINDAHNQLQTAANQPSASKIENNTISYVSKSNYDGALSYNPTQPISFPTFTLYVKADKLGFVQPAPQVSNLSVQFNPTSKSGDIQDILLTWTNSGQTGNFSVSTNCSGSYQSVEPTKEVNVAGKSTGSTTIQIQGTCSTTQTGSCTAKVTPISTFGGVVNSATYPMQLVCSPEQVCQPNTKWCVSNTELKSCNSQGQFSGITDCAGQGKICDAGACVTTPAQARCGNSLCEFGEEVVCPQDCASPTPTPLPTPIPSQQCDAGYHLVTVNEPVWWSFGLLKTTTTSCEKDSDYTIAVIVFIVAVTLIIMAFIFKRNPVQNQAKKIRKRVGV